MIEKKKAVINENGIVENIIVCYDNFSIDGKVLKEVTQNTDINGKLENETFKRTTNKTLGK